MKSVTVTPEDQVRAHRGSSDCPQQSVYLDWMRILLARHGLTLHPSADLEKRKKAGEDISREESASGTATPEYSASDAGSDSAPRERHECVICGITTTSAAHLEVIVLFSLTSSGTVLLM